MSKTRNPTRKQGEAGRLAKPIVIARRLNIINAYARGKTVEQIALELNTTEDIVEREITVAVDQLVQYYGKPTPQHTFVRYAVFQLGVIRKLQELHEAFQSAQTKPTPQPQQNQQQPKTKIKQPKQEHRNLTAAVSALRAQSDIYDKILDRGISLGVIQQQSKRSSQLTDLLNATPKDLRLELHTQITTLTAILEKVEDHDNFKYKTRGRKQTSQRKIKKVKRNPNGFVFASPDWKFKPQTNIDSHKATLPTTTADVQKESARLQELKSMLKAETPQQTKTSTQTKNKNPQTKIETENQETSYLVPPQNK